MRRILQVKLTMDGRRVPTIFAQNMKQNDNETSNHYLDSLWIYFIFSILLALLVYSGNNYLYQMSLFYGSFAFFLMTAMISDFSAVLLDIRDLHIILPKPVTQKTVGMAKLLHVIIQLSFLSLSLVTIPFFVLLIQYGIVFLLISIIHIILINLLVIGLTALTYLLILRFFDGETLKDFITYVQIGFSIAIFIGYQLLVRSFQFVSFAYSFEPAWWHGFLFPIWYGANFEMIINGTYEPFYLLFSALGLVIPILFIWMYVKWNRIFVQNLQKLNDHSKRKKKKASRFRTFVLNVICQSKEERAFFRFAGSMMKNEREFKLRVYPTLGLSIFLPFIFIFNSLKSDIDYLSTSLLYLIIYLSLLIIPNIMILLKYSNNYKGAWIYKVAPIKELRPVFTGTIKALIFLMFLPIYLLFCIIFLFIFGLRILPDLIVVFLVACIFAVICFIIFKKSLPFSQSFDSYTQYTGCVIFVGLIFLTGIFAGLHWIALQFPFGIYAYLLLVAFCLIILWHHAFNITWEKIIR